MKPILTIAAKWAEFEANMLAHDSSPEREKLRCVFYAGAGALHDIVAELTERCNSCPGDEEIAVLEDISLELGSLAIAVVEDVDTSC